MNLVCTSQITITDQNDVSVLVLSNPSFVLPTDNQGNNGVFTDATTTATIYVGKTDDTANWTLTTAVSEGLVMSTDANAATQSISSMSTDTGYIDFTASKPGWDDLIATCIVSKSKMGANGPSIALIASKQSFTSTDGVLDPDQADITIMCIRQNIAGTAAFSAIGDVTGAITLSTADTRTITDYREYFFSTVVPVGDLRTLTAALFDTNRHVVVICSVGTRTHSITIIRNDTSTADPGADVTANSAFAATVTGDIAAIRNQLDGVIISWFYDYAPTLSSDPANVPYADWLNPDVREAHRGDMFYDTVAGAVYRFVPDGTTYKWLLVTDTLAAQAMEAANAAADAADGKRRVFVDTPYPPYDVGDLWATNYSIKRCIVAKILGESYSTADWAVASTNGADWEANVQNAPTWITDAPPIGEPGLYAGYTHFGFHDGVNWATYMNDQGEFYLTGSFGHGLTWESNVLTITGNLVIKNPATVRTDINVSDGADKTDYTDSRVANAVTANSITTILRPGGGRYSYSSQATGAIKITLPVTWNGAMISMFVDVFLFSSNDTFTLQLSGMLNTLNPALWSGPTANLLGNAASDNRVRFAHDGTHCCILIGNTASDTGYTPSYWAYPKVTVRDVQVSHNNYAIATWEAGWGVSIINTLTGITTSGDLADALIDAKSTKYIGNTPSADVENWGYPGDSTKTDGAKVHPESTLTTGNTNLEAGARYSKLSGGDIVFYDYYGGNFNEYKSLKKNRAGVCSHGQTVNVGYFRDAPTIIISPKAMAVYKTGLAQNQTLVLDAVDLRRSGDDWLFDAVCQLHLSSNSIVGASGGTGQTTGLRSTADQYLPLVWEGPKYGAEIVIGTTNVSTVTAEASLKVSSVVGPDENGNGLWYGVGARIGLQVYSAANGWVTSQLFEAEWPQVVFDRNGIVLTASATSITKMRLVYYYTVNAFNQNGGSEGLTVEDACTVSLTSSIYTLSANAIDADGIANYMAIG